MTWLVPLSDIQFGPEEKEAVIKVLDSGWLTMGSVTEAFEEEFKVYTGAKHAFAVSNATVALHMACLALGLRPGDEVIVPSLTFVATANAVRYTGATPVFADITSENDLTISLESIQQCFTPRTKAIIVMHYAGYACDMPAIQAWANEKGLPVIEDAAHAIGSSLEGRHLGTWGISGCFSFFSNKNLATGEGGMIVTEDDRLAEKFRLLRSHGMTSLTWDRYQGHAWSYDVVELGYNYRIDELRSAIGREQLKKLDANNARRKQLTELYRKLLNEQVPSVILPFEGHPGIHAYHIMPILLPQGTDRIRFMENMKREGVQTSVHYPPIHQFTSFSSTSLQKSHLEMTDHLAQLEVTLPLYPLLSEDQVRLVVRAVSRSLV